MLAGQVDDGVVVGAVEPCAQCVLVLAGNDPVGQRAEDVLARNAGVETVETDRQVWPPGADCCGEVECETHRSVHGYGDRDCVDVVDQARIE